MSLPDILSHGLCVAVIAWTATNILMEDGGILYRYFRWLDLQAYKGRAWLARPLGLCAKCFAGQIALWSGFFALSLDYAVIPLAAAAKHILLICLAVWLTYQLDHFKTNT